MKLPDFTALGERPSPAAPPPVVGYRPTSGFEQAPAEAMSHTGAELQQAADYLNKAQLEHDAVRAQDATNQGLSLQQDLTFGDNGFTKLKGGNAVNAPLLKDYGSAFDSKVQEIENTLENDNQKQAFRRRMGVAGLQMREDIVRHVAQQSDIQAEETYKSGLAVNKQLASSRWDKPDSAKKALLDDDDLIYKAAARKGFSQQWVDTEKARASSDIYSGMILTALDASPVSGYQLFRQYGDMLTPDEKLVVGHRVNQTIIPAQAKTLADYVISGKDPKALPALQTTLDIGGQSALQKVSQDINAEQNSSTSKRETKGMLATWLSDGARMAEALRPNDPVFKDTVIGQIKNHVSTIVAMQQGVQTQAQGILLAASNGGPDGQQPRPTTLDQLLSTPAMRQAYQLLDPAAANGIRNLISHNAVEAERGHPLRSDAVVVNDLFQRIALPDNDPKKISRWEQLTPYFAHGVNRADMDWLRGLINSNTTPDGQRLSDVRKQTLGALRSQIVRPGMGIKDDKGDELYNNFTQFATKKEADYRREGKDPYSLYDYQSPNYIGKQIGTFQRTIDEIIKDKASSLKGATQPLAPEKMRKQGESIDDYRKRMGMQ